MRHPRPDLFTQVAGVTRPVSATTSRTPPFSIQSSACESDTDGSRLATNTPKLSTTRSPRPAATRYSSTRPPASSPPGPSSTRHCCRRTAPETAGHHQAREAAPPEALLRERVDRAAPRRRGGSAGARFLVGEDAAVRHSPLWPTAENWPPPATCTLATAAMLPSADQLWTGGGLIHPA